MGMWAQHYAPEGPNAQAASSRMTKMQILFGSVLPTAALLTPPAALPASISAPAVVRVQQLQSPSSSKQPSIGEQQSKHLDVAVRGRVCACWSADRQGCFAHA